MRVSLNELEVTARKAAIGLGVPVGLAHEAGRAVVWLAAAGVAPLPCYLSALDYLARGGKLADSIIHLGPASLDRLTVDGADQSIGPMDGAELMLGLIARADWLPDPVTVTLRDKSDGTVSLTVINGRCAMTGGPLSGPCEILLRATGDPAQNTTEVHSSALTGADVSEDEWHALEAHAARILVPADPHSRAKGAGAGLVDRD